MGKKLNTLIMAALLAVGVKAKAEEAKGNIQPVDSVKVYQEAAQAYLDKAANLEKHNLGVVMLGVLLI